MRTILITGGAGFIGGNFVHYWTREHPSDKVIVLDAITCAGNVTTLAALLGRSAIRFVHGDITNATLVGRTLADFGIDTIVHFAAESHVDRSSILARSFARTSSEHRHCSTLHCSHGRSTVGGRPAFVFTTCPRTRCTAHWS